MISNYNQILKAVENFHLLGRSRIGRFYPAGKQVIEKGI